MPRFITWLHLSDLHACKPRTGWDARRVLETLQDDLRLMNREYALRPDLIFFTGDAAWGQIGQNRGEQIVDQFRHAHDFLMGVRECFVPVVPQRDLYLVPGNHDVNIKKITKIETAWIRDLTSPDELNEIIQVAGIDWKYLMKRLEDYTNFLDTYGYTHLLTRRDRLTYADVREICGLRVGIAGFNSAWSSRGAGREEIGRLWMAGRLQLETILGEMPSHDFRIALIHHPGNWLVPEENPGFGRELRRDFHFLLHGHEHQDFVDADATNGHTVLSAGACHEWSQSANNGYTFARLDLDRLCLQVWLRRYDSVGAGWGPRFIKGKTDDSGRIVLAHVEPWLRKIVSASHASQFKPDDTAVENTKAQDGHESGSDYEQRYRKAVGDRLDYMHLFGLDVPRETKEYSLSVAYVSLNLADESEEIEEIFNETGAEVESHSLPAEAFFDKLNGESKRLLIRGSAGSGKTTLLRWAAVQAGKFASGVSSTDDWRALVPFIVKLRDYPDGDLPRSKDYHLILAKQLPDPPALWMDGLLRDGRALIMFDGADEVPLARRDRAIDEIRQVMTAYPNNAYVITTRPEAVGRMGFEALGFTAARVEPLAAVERDDFVDRWHEAMETHLRSLNKAEDLRSIAMLLKRQLEDAPAIARLTTNPLLCAAVCALHFRRNQNLPETPVDLCEKLCEMLIERRDREQRIDRDNFLNLDYSKQKGLLARLAHSMVISGLSAVTDEEVLEQISLGLESHGIPRSQAPSVRQALIERSGMLQESSERTVEFIHNTLKEYLAAEIFANRSDVETLRDHCFEESWQSVILFAVALPREGSDYATQVVRAIMGAIALWPIGPGKNRGPGSRPSRSLQFFLYRCCFAAHQLQGEDILATVRGLLSELIPPRSMSDAQAVAACGEAIAPHLVRQAQWSFRRRAACVRALGLIGGPRAARSLQTYQADESTSVIIEILGIRTSGVALKPTAKITRLSLRDKRKFKNVAGLAGLSNLQSLDLSRTQASDIFALSALPNLQSLDLSGTQVSDISALSALSNLQSLTLGGSQVSDISALSALSNLQSLDLGGSQVSDISALSALSNLQSLDLSGTGISDISALLALADLRSLDLTGTLISDISVLSALSNLQSLSLGHTQTCDISALSALSNLQSLNLWHVQVSDISALSSLSSLQSLTLADTLVSDISALSALSNLQSLSLWRTHVSDISALSILSNLRSLNLTATQVSDISALSALSNLQSLDLTATRVSDVSALSVLSNLRSLDLTGTQVSDISALSALSNLQSLGLRHTQVSNASALSALSNLRSLRLRISK